MVKFVLTSTTKRAWKSMGIDSDPEEYIEFETLEQFIEWVNKQDDLVILGGVMHETQMPVIELYDNYRE